MADETMLGGGTEQNTEGQQNTAEVEQSTEGQTQQTQANGEQSQEAQGANKETEAAQGAPEKYEFATPEGVELDQVVLSEFEGVAKELNLPQDKAQKVIDKIAPKIAQRQAEQMAENFEKAKTAWAEQSKTDKEFGGSNFDESLGTAKKALEAFGSPELRKLLSDSGMGNHPEVIRAFYKVGKAISEDKLVTGSKAPAKSDSRTLYPNSQMNP